MADKLTREEHHARAMLLGGWYASISHMYYFSGNGETYRLDADTLEPITRWQAGKRYTAGKEANRT